MSIFRSLSISNKLLVIILPIILLSFLILGQITNQKVKSALGDETVRQLQATAASLGDMVAIANESTVRDADAKMSNLLQLMSGSFALDSGTVRIGEIDTPVLKFNGAPVNLNFSQVDRFSSQNANSVATIFVRKGDDFVRISTSLKKEDGTRAVGTLLGNAHPAFAPLMRGELYHGKAKLFGHSYMTKYLPIRGAGNAVIGALFVGTNIDNVIEKLEKTIASVKIGTTGYIFVADNGTTKTRGEFVIHPDKKNIGKNGVEFKDANGKEFMKEILDAKNGQIKYKWKNTDETIAREKFAVFVTAPSWNWLIACSGYTNELYAVAGSIRNYIILATLLCVAVLAVVIVLTTRRLLAPIKETATILEKIADGDLTVQPHAAGSIDEIGTMQRACQNMVTRLNDMLRRTAENATQVASAANQLHSTAEQMATGSEELVAQTGSVGTASEEMSATSTDIARSCTAAATASEKSTQSAMDGARVVQETIMGMNTIADQVRDTSKSIEALGARSEQIGNIVGTIEDIADQTNLLALNAAIEAARAGEQGRGFAVVADEVRALAERTTKATKEIGDMIREIQGETRKAVMAMESGVQEAERGAESALKSGVALDTILDSINEVGMQVSQIATAAEQQTATTSEVAANIQQITEVVEQSARGSQESAEASEQLARLANELQNIVSQFKLAV